MKYLKKFNENISTEDLKDLVNSCLIYLLDDNFIVDIYQRPTISRVFGKKKYELFLRKNDSKNDSIVHFIKNPLNIPDYNKDGLIYSWNEVKDQFIPFIELLNRRYKIESTFWFNSNNLIRKALGKMKITSSFKELNYSISDLLNDNVDLDKISLIKIIISEK